MYAITGITGKVGGALARVLLAAGLPVRAVMRDASKGTEWEALGCEVAYADMADAPALAAAFAGAEAVFVVPPPVFDPGPGYPEARAVAEALVAALARARPSRLLWLSTIGAEAARDNLLSQHTLMEAALEGLDLPLAILRPAWFIDNAAWDVATVRKTGRLPSLLQPLDRPIPMVAAQDVGRVSAELIRQAWTGRRIIDLEGPVRVSPNDLARAFADVLGRPVQAVAVPRETWEELFRSQGMKNPGPRARMIDGFNQGWIAFQDGGREAIKGRIDAAEVIAALVEASSGWSRAGG